MFVTYPNYLACACRWQRLPENARKQGMLLAGSAHGAHLPLSPIFLGCRAGGSRSVVRQLSYKTLGHETDSRDLCFLPRRCRAAETGGKLFPDDQPQLSAPGLHQAPGQEMVENGREESPGLLTHPGAGGLGGRRHCGGENRRSHKLVLLCGAGQSGFALAWRLHRKNRGGGEDLRHVLPAGLHRHHEEDFDRLADAVRETAAVGEPIQRGPEYLLRAEILPENGGGGGMGFAVPGSRKGSGGQRFYLSPGVPLDCGLASAGGYCPCLPVCKRQDII